MARLLVFEDSVYWTRDGAVHTGQSFLWFVGHLAERGHELTLLGRLHPTPGTSFYRLPDQVRLAALPHYASLAGPDALPALVRSLRVAWRAIGQSEVVWVLGPHPLGVALLVLARLRGRPVVLGVRQDLPSYVRHRRPGRPLTHLVADLLERVWRGAARRHATVAVGPVLAEAYGHAQRLLRLDVSVVREVTATAPPSDEPGQDELRVLSVGRIESEKNPLLLADVLRELVSEDPRWRLVVCGDGDLRPALEQRLTELGVRDRAELRGYVPVHDGLEQVYRSCDALLHVSWTEGVPQVLYEAWAAGIPVVATQVGGVGPVADGAALLVPPGDAAAAAAAVLRLVHDRALRQRMVTAGRERASAATIDVVLGRLDAFLRAAAGQDVGEAVCAA